MIVEFFKDLDQSWVPIERERMTLHIIGSAALFLQTDYERGTKDADVIEVANLTPDLRARLTDVAGKNSVLHHKHGLYLDIVRRVLPFLPESPVYHGWHGFVFKNFELKVLDVADVVVSKLKPFRTNDKSDIAALVDRGYLDHDKLIERFKSAIERWSFDARAEEFPTCVENLHAVERNFFHVPETPIELPNWVGA